MVNSTVSSFQRVKSLNVMLTSFVDSVTSMAIYNKYRKHYDGFGRKGCGIKT